MNEQAQIEMYKVGKALDALTNGKRSFNGEEIADLMRLVNGVTMTICMGLSGQNAKAARELIIVTHQQLMKDIDEMLAGNTSAFIQEDETEFKARH